MEMNLSTLDYRRKRYDIIQVLNKSNIDDNDMNKFYASKNNNQ